MLIIEEPFPLEVEAEPLSPEKVAQLTKIFEESEAELKAELEECARKQALSEWYAMQLPPDGV